MSRDRKGNIQNWSSLFVSLGEARARVGVDEVAGPAGLDSNLKVK
jgi:hypothetical protein